MGEGQEGSNLVDIDEDVVVLVVSGDAALSNQLTLVQIVPILLTVELVHLQGLLVHVRSDVEGRLVVDAVVEGHIAGHSHFSVGVNSNHVLIGTKCNIDHKRINVDRLVDQSIVSVSKSHKSIDLGVLGGFVPGSAHQESAHDVSVNGEEEVSVGGVNAGLIERVRAAEVVPVLGLEKAVDCRPNIEQRREGPSSWGGNRRVEAVWCYYGICKCRDAQCKQN